MTQLASYYKLVDRDTENVGAKWKVLAVISLVVAVSAAVTCSFSFFSLQYEFDRCILKAMPVLQVVTNDKDENKTMLDMVHSNWGVAEDCSFAVFSPLFQGMTGIIFIVMFIICGNGGASKTNLIPQPYHIVIPATLYFLAMIVLSAIEVPFINDGLMEFCNQLLNQSTLMNEGNVSCANVLDKYSMPENQLLGRTNATTQFYVMNASWNYYFTIVLIWTTLFAFLAGFFVMIFRCLFVADFELIKVTITKQDDDERDVLHRAEVHAEADISTSNSSGNKKLRDVRRRRIVVDERDAARLLSSPSASSTESSPITERMQLNSFNEFELNTERPRRPNKAD